MGLRVIARDGGPLTAEAVFARNLMRDLEFYLPVLALLAPQAMLPSAPGWGQLLAAVWLLVFALMPLFNHDRLRCGDLVAGTLVVRAPAAVLLSDLAAARPEAARLQTAAHRPSEPPPPPREELTFTREQLDIYGIHELQVLEDLLSRQDQGTLDARSSRTSARRSRPRSAGPPSAGTCPPAPSWTPSTAPSAGAGAEDAVRAAAGA